MIEAMSRHLLSAAQNDDSDGASGVSIRRRDRSCK